MQCKNIPRFFWECEEDKVLDSSTYKNTISVSTYSAMETLMNIIEVLTDTFKLHHSERDWEDKYNILEI